MSESSLQKELKLLKDYNRALEYQNQTRDQERKRLEFEIQKLLRQVSSAGGPCPDCQQYKMEIRMCKDTIDRLEREKSNIQSTYEVLSKQVLQKNSISEHRHVSSLAVTQANISHSEFNSIKVKLEQTERSLSQLRIVQRKLREDNYYLETTVSSLQSQLSILNTKYFKLESEMKINTNSFHVNEHKHVSSVAVNSNVSVFQFNTVRLKLEQLQIDYNQLKSIQMKLHEEKTFLQAQLSRVNSKLYKLQNQLKVSTSSKETIVVLERQISKFTSQILILKSQLETKNSQIQKLKSQPTIVTSSVETIEHQNLKTQVSTWKYKFEELQRKWDSKERQYSISANEHEKLKTQVTTWKYKFEELQRKWDSKERQNSISANQHQNLKTQVSTWKYKFEELQRKWDSKERQNSVSVNQHEKLKNEVTTWKYKFQELQRKWDSRERQQSSRTDKISRLEKSITDFERKVTELNSEIYYTKSQLESKTREISQLKSQASRKVVTSSVITNSDHQGIKHELSLWKSKYESLFTENNELNKKSTITSTAVSNKQKEEREQLQREFNNIQLQLQNKREQIATLRVRYEQEMQNKNQEIHMLETRISSHQVRIEEISIQLERKIHLVAHPPQPNQNGEVLYLKSQLQKLSSLNKGLSNHISSLKQEQVRYFERFRDFEARIRVLEGANASLQYELRKSIESRGSQGNMSHSTYIQSNNNEFRRLIQELQSELEESRRVNSMITLENGKMKERLYQRERLYEFEQNQQENHRHFSPQKHVYSVEQPKQVHVVSYGEPIIANLEQHHYSEDRYANPTLDKRRGNINDEKWKALQYKISKLKNQNQGLKKSLYNMDDN